MESLRKGLVGEWLFDGDAKDTSGQGNHGTVTGATTSKDSLNRNNRAYLYAEGDDITVADDDVYSFSDGSTDEPFSVAILANINDTYKSRLIGKITDNASLDREWLFFSSATNTLSFSAFDPRPGNANRTATSTGTITHLEGEWHLYMVTYDGVDENGMTIYIDGEVLPTNNTTYSGTTGSGYVAMVPDDGPVRIGAFPSSVPVSISGSIEYSKVWDRELSVNDALQLTMDIKDNYQGLFEGCVLNVDIKDGAILDSSEYQHPTTVTGCPLVTDRFGIPYSACTMSGTFTGSTDWIEVPDHSVLHTSTGEGGTDYPVSGSAWVTLGVDSDHAFNVIEGQNGGGTRALSFYTVADGSLVLLLLSTTWAAGAIYGWGDLDTLDIGTLYCIGFTYDGSKDKAGIRLFLDGERIDDGIGYENATYIGMPILNEPYVIGANGTSGSAGFNGTIESYVRWNRQLSDAEMKAYYNITKTKADFNEYIR